MEETAYAKVNLALHVRAREPDGYHSIETLFAFAEDGDRLTYQPSDELSLRISGRFAPDLDASDDNLILRAAWALKESFDVGEGAALHLVKELPVAAGIGGGSADAAAALRLLNRAWEIHAGEEALLEIARMLGADVPACLLSRTVRGEGRGDILLPQATQLEGTPLLLINPLVPVPTGAVFMGWDGMDRGVLDPSDPRGGRNDLEAPAVAIAPVIADVLEALRGQAGVRLSRMSGSGATCFALFGSADERDVAAARIANAHPDWWQLGSRLR